MVYNIGMRVITGKYKGRKLVAPKNDTRPTLDRAKETLFNMLGDLNGAKVLDLFAGSGQIALECLSRGADCAVMCDSGKDAQAAIVANFKQLGQQPQLFRCDYMQCLRALGGQKFDLVYLDPPYKSDVYVSATQAILDGDMLADGGTIVCEHSVDVVLGEGFCGLCLEKSRKVGTVMFSFYKRQSDVVAKEQL